MTGPHRTGEERNDESRHPRAGVSWTQLPRHSACTAEGHYPIPWFQEHLVHSPPGLKNMSDLLACLPNIKALISFFLWEQWLPSKRWHTQEQQFLIAYLLGREKKKVQVEIQKVWPEWPEGFLKVAPRMPIWWDLGVGVGTAMSQERWALPRMVKAMVKDELRLEPKSQSQDPCNIAGNKIHPEIKCTQ